MKHSSNGLSNVYYLDKTKNTDSPTKRNPAIQKVSDTSVSSVPDYTRLTDSTQLLRNELRAAEASLALFQIQIEQSITDSLHLDFAGTRRSSL